MARFTWHYLEPSNPEKKKQPIITARPKPVAKRERDESPARRRDGGEVVRRRDREHESAGSASVSVGDRHLALRPRLGDVSVPAASGSVSGSVLVDRATLREISQSLKASHTAIRHCARLCDSAATTFNEEAQSVSDARAQVDALLAIVQLQRGATLDG